jgi:protocatechuate 3,4-dioxygenase beta subunit
MFTLILFGLLTMNARAIGQARDPLAAGAGSISGRVVERDTDTPLSRVTVRLQRRDDTNHVQAVSDPEGRYRFTDVQPGDYAIWATPDAHRSTHLAQVLGESGPRGNLNLRQRPVISIAKGQQLSGIDIALTRALAIEGRVLDPADAPMVETEVVAMPTDGTTHAASAHTDDQGVYRLFGLLPGSYHVCAHANGIYVDAAGEGRRLAPTCHPATTMGRQARDVTVSERDVTGIDVHVQTVTTFAIEGTVVDAAGGTAAAVDVGAVSFDDQPASAHTVSHDGAFRLDNLPPGRYRLKASIGRRREPGSSQDQREPQAAVMSVDITSGDVRNVVLAMSRPATVSGRLFFEGRPSPDPKQLRMMARAHVLGAVVREIPSAAPVDDRLAFQLPDVYPLPTAVVIDGLPRGWAVKSMRQDRRDVRHGPIEVSSPAPIDIVLTNRVAQVSLRVVDNQGEADAPCYVFLLPIEPSSWRTAFATYPHVEWRPAQAAVLTVIPGDYLVAALTWGEMRRLAADPDRIDEVGAAAVRMQFRTSDAGTRDVPVIHLPRR